MDASTKRGSLTERISNMGILRFSTIQTRLTFFFTVLPFVSIGTAGAVNYRQSSAALNGKIELYSRQIIGQIGSNLDLELRHIQLVMEDMISGEDVQSGLAGLKAREAEERQDVHTNAIDRRIDDTMKGKSFLSVSKPIRSATDGSPLGVIVITLEESRIAGLYEDIDLGRAAEIFVLDEQGTVISSRDQTKYSVNRPFPDRERWRKRRASRPLRNCCGSRATRRCWRSAISRPSPRKRRRLRRRRTPSRKSRCGRDAPIFKSNGVALG